MFHLLLHISWGSCCFSDCGGTLSVSAITNETIPLFLFFFLSHCRSLHFIMQAAWRYLTECAICNPQLQSLSHYRCIAGSLTPLLPATVKQGRNDDAAVWRESERKERQTPKHLCGCRCFGITSVCGRVLAQLPFRCLTDCGMKSSHVILYC